MSKKWLLSVVSLLFAFGLAACGGNDDAGDNNGDKDNDKNNAAKDEQEDKELVGGAPFQDGSYTLEELDFDENGWRVIFTLTVDDGKISKSDYNYVNENGDLKSEDDNYQELMSSKTGVGPQDYLPNLNGQLVDKQDPMQVDVVTGATHSSEKFMNYAQQLVQAAQKGDTTKIEIHNGSPLQDGEYSIAEKNPDANGWKNYLKITVDGGKITAVDFNSVDTEGNLKTENDDYQKRMSEKTGVGPQDYVPALEEALIEHQNTKGISVVAGATHSTHIFKIYAAQLINAAQKGDTTPIEVDNLVFK